MKKLSVVTLSCMCADVFDNKITAGGEALNFAADICVNAHISVTVIGAIADDEYGKFILDSIEHKPINKEFIHIVKGETAYNRTYLTDKGDRYYKPDSWHGGVMEKYRLSDNDKEKIKSADLVHVTRHCPNFPEVIDCKKSADFLLAVDFDISRDYENWDSVLPYCNFVFISGNEEVKEKAKQLAFKYSDTIFTVTLAENGSIAFKNTEEFICSAVPVKEVIDTTGCGDSYEAGFLSEYLKSADIKKAMENGSRTASVTLSFMGGF